MTCRREILGLRDPNPWIRAVSPAGSLPASHRSRRPGNAGESLRSLRGSGERDTRWAGRVPPPPSRLAAGEGWQLLLQQLNASSHREPRPPLEYGPTSVKRKSPRINQHPVIDLIWFHPAISWLSKQLFQEVPGDRRAAQHVALCCSHQGQTHTDGHKTFPNYLQRTGWERKRT